MVDLALDGGLGENARGADERRGGQPRVDRGSDLEGTQDRGLGRRRVEALASHALDLVGELVTVDVLAEQVLGVTGVGDLDAAQHLASHDLDVLVVEVDALRVVDLLHVLDERVHRGLDVGQLAQVAEVDEALGDLVTGADLAAILDAGHELDGGGDALLVQDAGSGRPCR